MNKYTIDELKEIISNCKGKIDHVYLHWTAGRYHQYFSEYHILIDDDGSILLPSEDLTVMRYHTWKRNSNAVGIALCAAYGAVANAGWDADMGDYPVTEKQIEVASMIIALFIKYAYIDIENVLTHCEAAYFDGYGPYSGDADTRWDLWYLQDSAFGYQPRNGGEVLRGKAQWYLSNADL